MNKILTLGWMGSMTYGSYALGEFLKMATLGLVIFTIFGFFLSVIIRFGLLGEGDGFADSMSDFICDFSDFGGGSCDNGGGDCGSCGGSD